MVDIIDLDKERRKRIFELTAEGNVCERRYKGIDRQPQSVSGIS